VAVSAFCIAAFTRSSPTRQTAPPPVAGRGGGLSIFASLDFWRMTPIIFFCNGTLLAFHGLWAGPYLFDVLLLDKVAAGNVLLIMGLGVSLGYLVSGFLSDRFGLARVVVTGGLVCTLSQFSLALRPSLPLVTILAFLFGFFGAFCIMVLVQPRSVFPPHLMGRAVTAVNLFSIGGTFLLQWLIGVIINTFPVNSLGQYPPEAHSAALLVTGTGSLLSVLWYLPLVKTRKTRAALVSEPGGDG
jgi:MFS family permease